METGAFERTEYFDQSDTNVPEEASPSKRSYVPWSQTRVGATTTSPWSTVCRILVTWPDGVDGWGSGVMVGRRHMLTVAHNLYSKKHGGWPRGIIVVPGFNGRAAKAVPFGAALVRSYRIPEDFKLSEDRGKGDFQSDYGIVSLNADVGLRSGYLGIGHVSNVTSVVGNYAGYPITLDNGECQWFVRGSLTSATETYVVTPFPSAPGTSGAGLFLSYGSSRTVFGTLIGNVPGTGTFFCRLNPYRVLFLRDFIRTH